MIKDCDLASSTALTYVGHVAYLQSLYGFRRPVWKKLPRYGRICRSLRKLSVSKAKEKFPITFRHASKIVFDLWPVSSSDVPFVAILLFGIVGLFRLGEVLSTVEVRKMRYLSFTFYWSGGSGFARDVPSGCSGPIPSPWLINRSYNLPMFCSGLPNPHFVSVTFVIVL